MPTAQAATDAQPLRSTPIARRGTEPRGVGASTRHSGMRRATAAAGSDAPRSAVGVGAKPPRPIQAVAKGMSESR